MSTTDSPLISGLEVWHPLPSRSHGLPTHTTLPPPPDHFLSRPFSNTHRYKIHSQSWEWRGRGWRRIWRLGGCGELFNNVLKSGQIDNWGLREQVMSTSLVIRTPAPPAWMRSDYIMTVNPAARSLIPTLPQAIQKPAFTPSASQLLLYVYIYI